MDRVINIKVPSNLYTAIAQDASTNLRSIRAQMLFDLLKLYNMKIEPNTEETQQKYNNNQQNQYLHNCIYAGCANKLTDSQYKITKGLCKQHADKKPSYEVV